MTALNPELDQNVSARTHPFARSAIPANWAPFIRSEKGAFSGWTPRRGPKKDERRARKRAPVRETASSFSIPSF